MKGKAGVGPLEDSPKKPTKDAFAAARAATGQENDAPAERFDAGQATMPAGTPDVPKPVRGHKMLAHFVGTHLTRNKDMEPMMSFELSFPLTPEHEGLLPAQVESAWKVIKKGAVKRIDVKDIPPQTVTLALVPDDEEGDLTIVAAEITKSSLSTVQEKGAGKSREIVRYKFHVSTPRGKERIAFGSTYDGEGVWYSAKKTQESLLD